MSAITQTKPDRRGSRKVAAVLAGGLVLGIGAMATLAAWDDSELGANFTAGRVVVEGAASPRSNVTADSAVAQASTSTITWKLQAVVN